MIFLKKYKNYLLFASLFFIPTLVYASSGADDFPIYVALLMEAFISIHMSAFVLSPLAEIISYENKKQIFWILFTVRAFILLIFDFFISTSIAIFDFIFVFIGELIILHI